MSKYLTRLALIPVLVTFGLVLVADRQNSTWVGGGTAVAEASAEVAGAATQRDPVWDLVKQSGRPPEQVTLPVAYLGLRQAVAAAGVKLNQADQVEAYPDPSWGYGGIAQVYRAQTVAVTDAKQTTTYYTWQPTVQAFLDEAKIELGDQDKIQPAPTDSLQTMTPGTPVKIVITRVSETKLTDRQSIPLTTSYKDDPTSEKGTQKVVQNGHSGTKAFLYLVRREDGVEVSRTLLATTIETPMVPTIISRGTKILLYGTGTATFYDSTRKMAASSNTIPPGAQARVVNTANGKSVVVTIEGGGLQGSTIDLSRDAFAVIGSLSTGRVPVRIEKVYN